MGVVRGVGGVRQGCVLQAKQPLPCPLPSLVTFKRVFRVKGTHHVADVWRATQHMEAVVGGNGEKAAAPARSRGGKGFSAGLDERYQFENFVLGKSNELGFAAAQQVTQDPGKAYNPLLLYGSTGLGKTHLLHAIGHKLAQRNPDFKIVYLHSEKFVSEMIQALRHASIDAFKARYRGVDALLMFR